MTTRATFADLTGTCLQGYVHTTYDNLVATFGEPHGTNGDKILAEWLLRFPDGTVATVYDYKNYHLASPESITEWHVGGKSPRAVELVEAALDRLPGEHDSRIDRSDPVQAAAEDRYLDSQD